MKLSELKSWDHNPREINTKAAAGLRESLERFGDLSGIVYNTRLEALVGGHQRAEQLVGLVGDADIVDIEEYNGERRGWIEHDGRRFAVRLVDWDETKHAAANLAANNPHIAGKFTDQLNSLARKVREADQELYESVRLDRLYTYRTQDNQSTNDRAEYGDAMIQKWGTERGQLWKIGRHRVVCGDATRESEVGVLDLDQHMMVTDPPYCSGGFQEAGKAEGSVGTKGAERIANDQLSTRGYASLIRNVLAVGNPNLVHIFTDWRMWVNLFDVVESSGFGVRSMVAWDKMSPGMGRGWRSQHELIMVAAKASQPFDPKSSQGNVIQCKRTGNKWHATEKPVEVLETVISVAGDIYPIVYDPFLGSGSTLIAAENQGRTCYGLELSPKYVAITCERASEAGLKCECEALE